MNIGDRLMHNLGTVWKVKDIFTHPWYDSPNDRYTYLLQLEKKPYQDIQVLNFHDLNKLSFGSGQKLSKKESDLVGKQVYYDSRSLWEVKSVRHNEIRIKLVRVIMEEIIMSEIGIRYTMEKLDD